MNQVEFAIISVFRLFSPGSRSFDRFFYYLCNYNTFKGMLVVGVIWWSWFHIKKGNFAVRSYLLSSLLAGFLALFIARTLALTLPHRLRPMNLPEFRILFHDSVVVRALSKWSAFPSDHAALFLALVVGFFFISRRQGITFFSCVLVFILFPRIYLGMHFPSDILAGGLIGGGSAFLLCRSRWVQGNLRKFILPWSEKNPGLFYAGFFIVTYQLATLFEDLRSLGKLISWYL